MNLELTTAPTLFGVYNDPLRDSRRHTTSVVYIVDIPKDAQPKAGDDATNVIRLPLADVEKNDFFVDHKTILHDFIKMRGRERGIAAGFTDIPPIPIDGDGEPFRRSVCPMN
jgi:ADP-ribose pyrophosphatase YjhB (NUDIX family)